MTQTEQVVKDVRPIATFLAQTERRGYFERGATVVALYVDPEAEGEQPDHPFATGHCVDPTLGEYTIMPARFRRAIDAIEAAAHGAGYLLWSERTTPGAPPVPVAG